MWPTMKKSTRLIELYVDFMLQVYKVDCVRTRRVLIESKVFHDINKDLTKKSTLICVIKLLDGFLEGDNLDVYSYLKNNLFFKGLK